VKSAAGTLRAPQPPALFSRNAPHSTASPEEIEVLESGSPTYEQRRAMLESLLPTDAVFSGNTSRAVPCGAVVLTTTTRADSHTDALAFYQHLRVANRALGCDFFEGVVMKRADCPYPAQLRSAAEEFRGWVKHRFLT
jgi:hypothetical protein